LRRTLARLREEEADPALIEEFETEYRNLSSLYKAATDTFDADRSEPRLPDALASLGFGDWTLSTCTASCMTRRWSYRLTTGASWRVASTRPTMPPRLLAVVEAED